MPWRPRVLVQGGIHYVYNRVGRGERFFDQEHEGAALVSLLGEAVQRGGLTVFAWCVV
jgi:hypothetical protein